MKNEGSLQGLLPLLMRLPVQQTENVFFVQIHRMNAAK